ncbi:MAG: WYL domain-containing protein [Acidobacteria bacterium]|nr:WYL domain-containing protein [Acidobacteriota bacterium]
MERHGEIVRQWRLILALETSRHGLTLSDLRRQADAGVSERTIRRDLDALGQAGFALDHERREGRTVYRLNQDVFRGLAQTGLSLSELCALHLSRSLLDALAGGPFQDHLRSAFDKLTDALPQPLWAFVDRLPTALVATGPELRTATGAHRHVDDLLRAVLSHQRVRMRYHSFSSGQTRDYTLEPYRVAYAQGALYLFAFVPDYGEMRTFALQRVESVALLEEHFTPEHAGDAMPRHSLSVFSGAPTAVAVWFTPTEARYVRERVWHPSQRLDDHADGSLTAHLDVVADWGLEAWILGFGPGARVVAPAWLAQRLAERLSAARRHYD